MPNNSLFPLVTMTMVFVALLVMLRPSSSLTVARGNNRATGITNVPSIGWASNLFLEIASTSYATTRQHRRRRNTYLCLSAKASDGDDDLETPEKTVGDVDASSSSSNDDDEDRIFQMVEVSFINSIVQLSSGNVDILKLFIISVKAGYERNIGPTAFVDAVNSLPTRAANRELLPEEIRLRTCSILAVYHALQYVGFPGGGDGGILQEYDTVMADLIVLLEIQKEEYKDLANLPPFDANGFCKLRSDILPKMETKLDMAIVSQTVRVIYYTLVVLEQKERLEQNNGGDEASSSSSPAPASKAKAPSSGKGFGKK